MIGKVGASPSAVLGAGSAAGDGGWSIVRNSPAGPSELLLAVRVRADAGLEHLCVITRIHGVDRVECIQHARHLTDAGHVTIAYGDPSGSVCYSAGSV